MNVSRAELHPAVRVAELRDLACRYRAIGVPPPDVDFTGGAGCPICGDPLRRGEAGWGCPPCTVGWDWRGTHGVWTAPVVAPTRQPLARLGWRWVRAARAAAET